MLVPNLMRPATGSVFKSHNLQRLQHPKRSVSLRAFQSGCIITLTGLTIHNNRLLWFTHSSVGLSFPPALVSTDLAVDFDNVSFSQ